MFWDFFSDYVDAVKDGFSGDASEAIGTIIAVGITAGPVCSNCAQRQDQSGVRGM